MRILLISDVSIHLVSSGAERVLYEHSTRLAKRGHEVHVLTRRLPEHGEETSTINGVREWRYRFPSKRICQICKSTFFDCRQLFSFLIRKYSFDVINLYQPLSGLGTFPSPVSSHIPKVYTCFSFAFEEFVSRNSLPTHPGRRLIFQAHLLGRKLVEKVLINRSKRIVVLSEYTKRRLKEVYGLHGSRITVIPGAVDIDRFKPAGERALNRRQLGISPNCSVLLTVRNLEPRMGLENLIFAFKKVVENQPDAFLIIGGKGPLEQKLRDLASNCGLAESIRFTGYIAEDALPAYYRIADLFILPTRELEGFGLVTVEALASGLPVLGTPVGGTQEILTHLGPGFLFNDSTPDSMAELILETLRTWTRDTSAHQKVSKRCRRLAERHYSWEDHITQLESLFQSTCA